MGSLEHGRFESLSFLSGFKEAPLIALMRFLLRAFLLLHCCTVVRGGCIETVAGGGVGDLGEFSEPQYMTLDSTRSVVFSAVNGIFRAV